MGQNVGGIGGTGGLQALVIWEIKRLEKTQIRDSTFPSSSQIFEGRMKVKEKHEIVIISSLHSYLDFILDAIINVMLFIISRLLRFQVSES